MIRAFKHSTNKALALSSIVAFFEGLQGFEVLKKYVVLKKVQVLNNNDQVLFSFNTERDGKAATPLKGNILVDEGRVIINMGIHVPQGEDLTVHVTNMRSVLATELEKLFAKTKESVSVGE